MPNKALKISIVIPAYNEEGHLAACLDAIAAQTIKPYEVIVVDNNSTDLTATIARRYPFVRLLAERRQGPVYARDHGFNAATGDVIGRTDADVLLAPDWVERLQELFADGKLDAVSGSIGFNDVPFEPFFRKVDSLCRHYLARSLARRNELFLFGGNMALRCSAWQKISSSLCRQQQFHEDIDIAAHMAHANFKNIFDDQLRAKVSARRIDSPLKSYYPYVVANSRTYAAHGLRGRFYMYPIEALVIIFYSPMRFLYCCYDPNSGRISLKYLRRNSFARVSPIADNV